MAALVLSLSACSSDEDASSKASDELLSVERVVAFGPTETSWEVKIAGPYRRFNPLYQKRPETGCDDPADQERC